MTLIIQNSAAFDNDGKRTPENDDIKIEDVGHIPEAVLSQFIKARYPKAISVKVFQQDT